MKASLRQSLATLVGSVTLLVAPAAFAVGEPCFNDDDCPGGGNVCGGDICDWSQGEIEAHPAEKPFICIAAGTGKTPSGDLAGKGKEGWCTFANGDANCKCRAEGAKCVGVYCTFTLPSDAPPGGGGGTGGTGSGTAGTGTDTAGTGTAGTGTAGTGTTPAPAPAAEEGGCSVSAPGRSNTGVALALGVGLAGLGVAFARRRR